MSDLKIKAIIFDFDDTLEDYSDAYLACELKFVPHFSKKFFVDGKKVRHLLHLTTKKYVLLGIKTKNPKYLDRHLWFLEIAEKLRIKISKKEIDCLVDFYWKLILNSAKLFPHSKNTVARLSKKYKLAMLSDSDGKKKIKLDRINKFGIGKYFSLILTSDDTNQNKPSRKNYELIFGKLGVHSKDCVMVGDKPEVDLKLAKSLGMTTIWVQRGWWSKKRIGKKYPYVDFYVKNINDIQKIIQKLN